MTVVPTSDRRITVACQNETNCAAIDKKVHVHDLHATILHLMGINHEHLTYFYNSREMRLTDVEGHVVHDLIA